MGRKFVMIGGLLFVFYKLGNLVGRIYTHEEFIKNYGSDIFEKHDEIKSHICRNILQVTTKKEND